MTMTEQLPKRSRVTATNEKTTSPAVPVASESAVAVPHAVDWVTTFGRAMAILAGLAAWLLVYGIGFSAIHEHRSQRVMYSHLREELAEATAPLSGHISDGAPLAILSAPAAGIANQVVVEGTTSSDLDNGPGHYPGTVLPGQAGIATIMGHHTTYGAPFRHLTSLHPGDPISVTTDQGIAHYVVQDVRAPGDPLPAALAAGASRLTLITSQSSGWRGAWAPTHAVYVDATLHGKPFAAATNDSVATSADAPMHGDSNSLVPLVLWLQGLAVVAIGIVFARARWGSRQTWVVGGSVLVALLWGATGAFMNLLPNLF
jgi:LPXTG-site transpeptidase (sortase) family protein